MNRFTRSENGIIADAGFYNRLQYANAASLLLLSDTHGAVDAVRWILSSFGGICDACLFAGDGAQDLLTVVREAAAGKITIPPVIIMAQGNCDNQLYPPVFPDTGSQKPFGLPVYQQKMIAGQHIFLTHGHLHHVELDGRKLSMTAESLGCTIAIHGHTHVQSIERFGSVTAINPGSPLRPRGKSHGQPPETVQLRNYPVQCNFISLYGKPTVLFLPPHTQSILSRYARVQGISHWA